MNAQELYNKAIRLRNFWLPRESRIYEWLDLEALVDENEKTGLESMTTNDPATLISLATHLLTHNPIHHRVLIGGEAGEKLERQAGRSERGLRSFWQMVDEDAMLGGRDTSLREIAWWALVTGWVNVMPLLTQNEDGSPHPLLYIHNPLESYQDYGPDVGLNQYAHIYNTTLADVRMKAYRWDSTITLTGDDATPMEIVDYWWVEWTGGVPISMNCVIVRGGSLYAPTFLKAPERWGTRIPIISIPVAGKPLRRLRGDEWKQTVGQGILEKNRIVYGEVNRFLSMLAQLALDATQPPWLLKGTGIRVTETDIRRGVPRLGGSIIQTTNPQASLQRIDPGRFPIELQQFMGVMDGMLQRGGFPYLMFGGLQTQLSGFAISQLMDAAFHQLGPYQRALQHVVAMVDKYWLESFRDGDYSSIQISGKERGGRESGWYVEEFRPGDIPKKLFLAAEVELSMPSDVLERMAIIRQAIPNGPILDRFTALEEILKMDDPYLVMQRLHKDAVEFNPITQQLEMIATLREKAADLREIGGEPNELTAQLLDQFAQFTLQQASQMMGGVRAEGAPARTAGIAPEQLPPEAQGLSPDAMRASLRRTPGTPNRSRAEQLREMGMM